MQLPRYRLGGRGFFKRSSIALGVGIAGLPRLVPSGVLGAAGKPGASTRLNVAQIGVGTLGMTRLAQLRQFESEGKVNITAVCDIDRGRLTAALRGLKPGVTTCLDYRRILEREDVDAVLIATPDHRHASQTIQACEAGKHVYVEMPAAMTVAEGRAMVQAARQHRVSVQAGALSRTARGAWQICQAIRNGMVGQVQSVSCWYRAVPGDSGSSRNHASLGRVDWHRWTRQGHWRLPHSRHLAGFTQWLAAAKEGHLRRYSANLFSAILWWMNADDQYPESVEVCGDDSQAAGSRTGMTIDYQFRNPDWTLRWRQSMMETFASRCGNLFSGNKGDLEVEWQEESRPVSPAAASFRPPSGAEEMTRTEYYPDPELNHQADWFSSILEGHLRPSMDIELGHRAGSLSILGNLALLLGRKVVWDGVGEKVVGDREAEDLLLRSAHFARGG